MVVRDYETYHRLEGPSEIEIVSESLRKSKAKRINVRVPDELVLTKMRKHYRRRLKKRKS
jgi:hypothetical protein